MDEVSFPNNADIPPAIPNGDHYQVVLVRVEKKRQYNGEKLFLWFQLMTPGDWVGELFYMVCTIAPQGRWSASHKYWQAWVLAAGKRPPRKDRMSTKVFENTVFRVRMRVVTKTAKQLPRTPAQQYSVVDELLERMTESA
jgi:hypothetical protein